MFINHSREHPKFQMFGLIVAQSPITIVACKRGLYMPFYRHLDHDWRAILSVLLYVNKIFKNVGIYSLNIYQSS